MSEEADLAASLIGRTITNAEWREAKPVGEWGEHEVCHLTLDDGRTVRFGGWGHDDWGATLDLVANSATPPGQTDDHA